MFEITESTTENYDVFVSYDELTGKDFATIIHRALTRRGYRVFVAHIDRPYRSGNYHNNFDRIIDSVEVFVLVNTLDALTRPEVIREIKGRFPSGTDLDDPNFWLFRHDEENVPRGSLDFTRQTGIVLENQNQSDFNNDSQVARGVLAKCDKKRLERTLTSLPGLRNAQKTTTNFKKPVLELIEKFAEKFRKKNFLVEMEKDLGKYFRADLVLEKDKEIILCEFKNNADEVRKESFSGYLLLKNELEHILPNKLIKLWMIAPGKFKSDIIDMGKKYNITLIDDNNIETYLEKQVETRKKENLLPSFGATIELDQKVYSWTDKVYITVVAPDFNLDPDVIDSIRVTVSTRNHKLSYYKLVETGKDTGIFAGQVCLTGFKHDSKGNNDGIPTAITFGEGPTDGHLEAENDDGLSVSFDYNDDETVVGSALIRWNIGEIAWLDANYPLNGKGVIRVIDPDMNLNAEKLDSFEITVWSDTDAVGTKIMVVETNESTGIFEGEVLFTDKKSGRNKIQVSQGDTVTAEYTDRTLPSPYDLTDKLKITATTFIGEIKPPLSRLVMRDPQIMDMDNNYVDKLSVKKDYRVSVIIENNQNREQQFALKIQIQDNYGITVYHNILKGELSALQSFRPHLPWKPIEPGTFRVNLFVWENEDNPVALSPPVHFTVDVIDNE